MSRKEGERQVNLKLQPVDGKWCARREGRCLRGKGKTARGGGKSVTPKE